MFRCHARATALLAISLWSFFGCLHLLSVYLERGEIYNFEYLLFGTVSGLGAAHSLVLIAVAWRSRNASPKARTVILIGSTAAFALTHAVLGHFTYEYFTVGRDEAPHASLGTAIVMNSLAYVWIHGMCVAVLVLLVSQSTIRRRETQLAEARDAANEAQLAALRFQLNPHFLFNTLNAISALIVDQRPTEADEVTNRLAEFLRASLRSSADGFVPLRAELESVRAYLEIERVRFADRMSVNIDCVPTLDEFLVPDFILQPLVENAVKHAVAPTAGAVEVLIDAVSSDRGLILKVEDRRSPDTPSGAARQGPGVGLRNIRRRLRALYGGGAELSVRRGSGGFIAILNLPVPREAHVLGNPLR